MKLYDDAPLTQEEIDYANNVVAKEYELLQSQLDHAQTHGEPIAPILRGYLLESGTTPVDSMPENPIYFSDVLIEPIDLLPLNQLPEEKIIVTEHIDFSTKKTN